MMKSLCILAVVPLAAACNDGMQVGSVHVKSGRIGNAGGALTVTENDHPQLAGTAIVIPPGALPDDTLVAIGISDATIRLDDAEPHGPALYFEPIGRALAAPARITVPFDEGQGSGLLIRTLVRGSVADVSSRITGIDDAAQLVTFELDTLAHVQPQVLFGPILVDAPCNSPQCQPPVDAGTDAPCLLGACPQPDGGTPPPDGPSNSCGLLGCPPGMTCTPAAGCQAICGNQICPAGQGCNQLTQCVEQCGMGGAITFLCPLNEHCDFATGTCAP
jgi:hypothetical protein